MSIAYFKFLTNINTSLYCIGGKISPATLALSIPGSRRCERFRFRTCCTLPGASKSQNISWDHEFMQKYSAAPLTVHIKSTYLPDICRQCQLRWPVNPRPSLSPHLPIAHRAPRSLYSPRHYAVASARWQRVDLRFFGLSPTSWATWWCCLEPVRLKKTQLSPRAALPYV